ncbi:3'-5' exonuclease [Acinetobacter sp. TUM15064]|uniref:3'-5' exonuclease n=1 Tax=Acinetobacter sp. TUM15064 TaxID=2609134 RepID=UPI00124C1CCF|nr:3'-5' exonuclease [Acinetobacter sp. TUM15064]
MKNKLMVDCETLDIGERPVLLSIGAVVFNDQQIQDYFEYFINKETAISEGFTVSQSTLDWWDQQDPDARAYAFNGEGDIQEALKALVQFYELNECTEIWSKGSLADIRWINNALDYFGIERPWKYYKEFCFRTLLKSVPKFDMPFVGMPHNALDDAIHQAKQFIEIKKMQATQQQLLIEQGQAFNDLSQKCADLEFKLLQKEAV